jgi:hypothetical protein
MTDQASVFAFKTPIKPMKSPKQCMPCTCTWKGTVEHCVSMRQYLYTMHGAEANCRLTTDLHKGTKDSNTETLNVSNDSKAQKLISRTYGTSCYALSNKTPAPLSEVWQSGRNRNIVRFTESNLAYCIAWGIVTPQSDCPTKLHDSRVTVTVTGHGSKPNQNSSTTALQHLSLNTS